MTDLADLFPGFATHWIATRAGRFFVRAKGDGPPLLLLHGYPQTHVEWHKIAPQLAERFTVVLMDLRGYGWSGAPRSENGALYTKRLMAQDAIAVMEQLGHIRFSLVGHDRGARVAYRLALDHPERLDKLALIDIIPTAARWQALNAAEALKAYHWTFLAQPEPMPETLIGGAAPFYRRFHAGELDRREGSLRLRPPCAGPLPRRLQRALAHSRRLRGLSRRRDARPRRRRGRSGRRQEDRGPGSGALGRARPRRRRRFDPRCLAPMGPQCAGPADRRRPFSARRKPGGDARGPAGVFVRTAARRAGDGSPVKPSSFMQRRGARLCAVWPSIFVRRDSHARNRGPSDRVFRHGIAVQPVALCG